MRFAGSRRLPAGWATVLGDIILRLTLVSVVGQTAQIMIAAGWYLCTGEAIFGQWTWVGIWLGGWWAPFLTPTGWVAIWFAIDSTLVVRRIRQTKNSAALRPKKRVKLFATATAIASAVSIINYGPLGIVALGWSLVPPFLALCALYGYSLLEQSREEKRTESVNGALLDGVDAGANDSSDRGDIKKGIVLRNTSQLGRKIFFRLLLMNGFYAVSTTILEFDMWFAEGQPLVLINLLAFGWFPWSVLQSGLLGYSCGILFAVGCVFVEHRTMGHKSPLIWRLRQLMGFAAVLIAIVLELVISDERAHSGYQPAIVPIVVCALYGYSLFAQGRDAKRPVTLGS